MLCGVYQIRCKITGVVYIGSSRDIRGRLYCHEFDLKHGKHYNKRLQRAWNQYGSSCFVFEVITISTENTRLFLENWLLSIIHKARLYNDRTWAVTNKGYWRRNPLSEDDKKKKSVAAIKRWESLEARQKQSTVMKLRQTPSARAKKRESNLVTWSDPLKIKEHSELMSKIHNSDIGRLNQSLRAKKRWADYRKKKADQNARTEN